MSWVKWWFREYGLIIGILAPIGLVVIAGSVLNEIGPASSIDTPPRIKLKDIVLVSTTQTTGPTEVKGQSNLRFAIKDYVFTSPFATQNLMLNALSVTRNSCEFFDESKRVSLVQIVANPVYITERTFWPIKVVQAETVYMEGCQGLVPETDLVEKAQTLPTPAKPNVKVGDKVKLNYSFVPKKSPCGDSKYYDILATFHGGFEVIITSEPVLCNNHWHCEVKVTNPEPRATPYSSDLMGLQGWIYCEVTKI